ncbi:MAG TPA: TIGR00282 family metallophosphoesterase [Ktedonobacterales bacterium]|nr:TIGR00282 family metallophosphoesterase [Ktedonobacterales bacterium]
MADDVLRLLFVGDVVGPAGCEATRRFIPALRRELALDAVVVNGENSAPNGLGITHETAKQILSVADFVTLGDHAFDQEGMEALFAVNPRVIRPLNFEGQHPGRGWGIFEAAGMHIGVVNLLGRVFMRPAASSQYAAADQAIQALAAAGVKVIVVDLQAEATSEKQMLGWYLEGRVSAVLGTHTHVPTADARVLPGGTAYVSDVGMTGARDGVIGFDRERLLVAARAGQKPAGPLKPAEGVQRLDAVLIVIDKASGRARAIERVVREG